MLDEVNNAFSGLYGSAMSFLRPRSGGTRPSLPETQVAPEDQARAQSYARELPLAYKRYIPNGVALTEEGLARLDTMVRHGQSPQTAMATLVAEDPWLISGKESQRPAGSTPYFMTEAH